MDDANVMGTITPPATVQPAATWLSAVDAPVVVFDPVNAIPRDALISDTNLVLFENEYTTIDRLTEPETLVVAKLNDIAMSTSDRFMTPGTKKRSRNRLLPSTSCEAVPAAEAISSPT